MRTIFLTIFLISMCTALSQNQPAPGDFNKIVDFLPPAPNAASIIKYGGISLNKNTGAPNISIPMYTVTNGKLSVPISLGYSSTGIRVDEIASRVGMGWTLNAGGVITRVIRGNPDDVTQRRIPYTTPGYDWSTYNFMRLIGEMSDQYSGYDSEPDMFHYNFNGISGAFVLDHDMTVVQIPQTANKIVYNFASTDWNFKITTPDGISYFFGGSSAREKTKRDQICGKTYNAYLTTAWYLKKIEHPNGQLIQFSYLPHEYTYDNGVAQTMYWTPPGSQPSGGIAGNCTSTNCSTPQNQTCINLTRTQGVLLNTIFVPGKTTVQFYYESRQDCGDKIISKIEMRYHGTGTLHSYFDLHYDWITSNLIYANQTEVGYDRTPFLKGVYERSSTGGAYKSHTFLYNDPAARPPRLSYSQDHWGYFNGKINTSFVPLPEQVEDRSRFPFATANREPQHYFAAKGMLAKIIYPTGGADTIIYEGNQIKELNKTRPKHELRCESTGTDFKTEVVKSNSFVLDASQNIYLRMECIDNSGTGNFDPLHNKGTVEILNSNGAEVFRKLLSPGDDQTQYPSLPAGSYTLNLYANGSVVTTRTTMQFYPTSTTTGYTNEPAPGLRVQTVLTSESNDSKPLVKKYYYGELNSLHFSSLHKVIKPIYIKEYKTRYFCPYCVGGNCAVNYLYCQNKSMSSSSINNLFDYTVSGISYQSILEGSGENFEGGAIHSTFYAQGDAGGSILMGDYVLNAPRTNLSTYMNGRPKEETILKRGLDGSLFPLKKTIYSYKTDFRHNKIIQAYLVNFKYPLHHYIDSCVANVSCPASFSYSIESFDLMKYDIINSWVYHDTLKEITYDQNGQNPLTTTTVFFYDNEQHLQLTKTKTWNSKNELVETEFKYPHDYPGQQVYEDMIVNHIIAPVISVQTFNGGNKATEVKTSYYNWGSGNFAPATVQKALKSHNLEVEGTIDSYDVFGNITQFTSRDGIPSSVIWGYNHSYPVAQITAATYNQAIAQLSVTVQSLQLLDGDALRTEINRIRTNIPSAKVTTYTYKHLVGVTSITDPNNRKVTYEYNAANQLMSIRDQDNNVVKKLEYNYALPQGTEPIFKIYFNDQMNQTFNCNSCQNGFMGSPVTYSVPYGKYFSLVSLQDANAKAQADLQANGQDYANKIGYCSTLLPCVGLDRKVIGCFCRQAVKIYTSSNQNANGTWTCNYYYRWPDGTRSQDYTETAQENCM